MTYLHDGRYGWLLQDDQRGIVFVCAWCDAHYSTQLDAKFCQRTEACRSQFDGCVEEGGAA
jgi:hypothetical protein